MDFLKGLLNKSDDPNEEINKIKDLIEQNRTDIQPPREMQANDSLLRERLAAAQPYPNAPFDPLGDKFGLMDGVFNQKPQETPELQLASQPTKVDEIKDKLNKIKETKKLTASSVVSSPIAKESSPLPEIKEQVPEQTPPSSNSDIDAFRQKLKDAQNVRDQEAKNRMLIDSAARIGTAIAGRGELKYDDSFLDNMKSQEGKDLKNLLQEETEVNTFAKNKNDRESDALKLDLSKLNFKDEKAKSDANSELSQVTRTSVIDSLNRMGRKDLASKISPNMSAKQVEDVFGQQNLANMMSQYEAQQNRLEIQRMRLDEKRQAGLNKLDKEKENFITQRYDKLTNSPKYKAMSQIGSFKKIIDDAVANPSGVKDINALYAMIKAMDPGSVVKEGELKLFDNAKSIWQKAGSSITSLGNNKRVLDMKSLNEIKKAMDAIFENTKNEYKMHTKSIYDQARKRGISDDDLGMMDPLYDMINQKDTPQTYNVDNDALAAELKRRGKK